MAKIIDGKKVSAAVRAQVRDEVVELVKRGVQPGLAVVIVGNDPVQILEFIQRNMRCRRPPHKKSYWPSWTS